MKTNKILNVMCAIIIIILLVLISFVGIYVYKNGKMVNIIKDYSLGMELGGAREIVVTPSTETRTVYKNEDGKELINTDNISEEDLKKYKEETVNINSSEVLTKENYEKSAKIFKERLDTLGLQEYLISVNEETGKVVIKAREDSSIDSMIYNAFVEGNLIMQDTETLEVLLDNSDLKKAQVGYHNTTAGTEIYLTMQLNKEGTKKLEEISKKYVASTDEEGKQTTKTVSLYIDETTLTTTYFGETIQNGVLQLSIGNATTSQAELQGYIMEATALATLLSSDPTPIGYEIESNQFISSYMTDYTKQLLITVAIILVTVAIAYLILEYKDRGIIAGITFIGYIALLLLAVRLSNTVITLESIGAIILSVIFNYGFLIVLLKRMTTYREREATPKAEMNRTIINAFWASIPALVVAVVFCFINFMAINSFGIALFWGVSVFAVYTLIITRTLLLNFEYLFEE